VRYITPIFKLIFDGDFRRCLLSCHRALKYAIYKKDYPRAIKEYKSILENGICGGQEAKIYRDLGEVYYWNGNVEDAEKALRKSLDLSMRKKSHDAHLYQLLGDICGKKGQYEDSLMFYEKAVQFGSEGFINKMLINMDYVLKQKAFLEENKDLLPFMTAYFQQNKHKFRNLKCLDNTE
jgi:tetratricopeptide (TPR) repeat protein